MAAAGTGDQARRIELRHMNAMPTNGCYEPPASARGVLVLADPPEAGWRLLTPSPERLTADADPLAARGCGRDRQRAGDSSGFESGGEG
jgi:hypothetical protein